MSKSSSVSFSQALASCGNVPRWKRNRSRIISMSFKWMRSQCVSKSHPTLSRLAKASLRLASSLPLDGGLPSPATAARLSLLPLHFVVVMSESLAFKTGASDWNNRSDCCVTDKCFAVMDLKFAPCIACAPRTNTQAPSLNSLSNSAMRRATSADKLGLLSAISL